MCAICHVLVRMLQCNGVLILVPPSQLQRLDKLQRWYLHELGLSDREAFVAHNFAPSSLRRAIGILGFLHKRVLQECHPALCQALPFAPEGLVARYHSNALDPSRGEAICEDRLYRRSLYAYILVYNRLPQTLADSPSVSSLQTRLTHLAKDMVPNSEDWILLLWPKLILRYNNISLDVFLLSRVFIFWMYSSL